MSATLCTWLPARSGANIKHRTEADTAGLLGCVPASLRLLEVHLGLLGSAGIPWTAPLMQVLMCAALDMIVLLPRPSDLPTLWNLLRVAMQEATLVVGCVDDGLLEIIAAHASGLVLEFTVEFIGARSWTLDLVKGSKVVDLATEFCLAPRDQRMVLVHTWTAEDSGRSGTQSFGSVVLVHPSAQFFFFRSSGWSRGCRRRVSLARRADGPGSPAGPALALGGPAQVEGTDGERFYPSGMGAASAPLDETACASITLRGKDVTTSTHTPAHPERAARTSTCHSRQAPMVSARLCGIVHCVGTCMN